MGKLWDNKKIHFEELETLDLKKSFSGAEKKEKIISKIIYNFGDEEFMINKSKIKLDMFEKSSNKAENATIFLENLENTK